MNIHERVLVEANYMIENQSTIREVAKLVGVSKSTIHRDFIWLLPQLNEKLYLKVKEVMDINKSERHIRGGIATKRKWKKEIR